MAPSRQRILHHATVPDHDIDDAKLLRSVQKQQLVTLCQQMNLPVTGTKEELLQRLRDHATSQVQADKARRLQRVQRVEEGSDDPKERHEIVTSPLDVEEEEDDDNDEEEDIFFYHAPEESFPTSDEKKEKTNEEERKSKKKMYITQADVTAPPAPAQPNEKGERVIQVYSTTDQNDLTGIAAAQPGQTAMSLDALTNAAPISQQQQTQPWDAQNNQKSTTSKEEENAKAEIIDLIQSLLSMTGLPAFYFGDGNDDDGIDPLSLSADSFTGFDPTKVSTDLLLASSQALRTGRGRILQEVLRQFEIQAIGQDGMHGDNVQSGGGHYREVAKIRAFLEGYRRAEVRRIARETTAILLDKLVLEGVEGLDMTLATMTRSSDDTSNHGGELNDSLLEYLNDAVRQQEKKVDKLVAERLEQSDKQINGATALGALEDDAVENLWNVTTTEDGQRMESLDPNDPRVKATLEEELAKEEVAQTLALERQKAVPNSAPEQLLLLLTLLRERIKAEAVFAPDEKGRNLRLLAYCLQLMSDGDRRQLVSKELGTSIDVRIFLFNFL